MSTPKHTPAPWNYENGNGVTACGNPLKVAGRTKVAIANRVLIAAAPDLFDGAADFIAYEDAIERGDDVQAMLLYASVRKKLRASHAKVTEAP